VNAVERIRTLVSLARPPVVLLMVLFAATGLAASGATDRPALAASVMVVVTGYLLFAVIVNDLADEAIDGVNLPGVAGRPLVEGRADRLELVVTAGVAATIAAAGALAIGWLALAVTTGGLVLAAGYSLPPIRLAGRGAVASLLLPAGYVAVPFLVGVMAADGPVGGRNGLLLAGLYVGFIGRILLKDFRDVRGDALFGKRTFLVRHGRVATCRFSAACWALGTGALFGVEDATPTLAASHLVLLGVALALLRRLRTDLGPRRDEALIAAIALVGRGMITILVVHLSLDDAGRSALATSALTVALSIIVLGQVHTMLRHGPRTRTKVPATWWAEPGGGRVSLPPPSMLVAGHESLQPLEDAVYAGTVQRHPPVHDEVLAGDVASQV
jgi:4-hydroxybenzoate polyprenyltransferase